MKLYLINPKSDEVAAELTPAKKVVIFSGWMVKSIEGDGIVVNKEFKEKFKTKNRVYEKDGEQLFALAFQKCYYESGPMQMGYYWTDKHPSTWPSDEELAKKILETYTRSVKKTSGE